MAGTNKDVTVMINDVGMETLLLLLRIMVLIIMTAVVGFQQDHSGRPNEIQWNLQDEKNAREYGGGGVGGFMK